MDFEISTHAIGQVILMSRELGRAEPELRGFIDRMARDEQAELVAIMWIGRGSFEANDWNDALETARVEATTPCADYLIGTPHLGENLEAGLEALGIDVTEVENEIL